MSQILEDSTHLVSRVIKHLQSFSNIGSRIQKIKKLLIVYFQKRDFHWKFRAILCEFFKYLMQRTGYYTC